MKRGFTLFTSLFLVFSSLYSAELGKPRVEFVSWNDRYSYIIDALVKNNENYCYLNFVNDTCIELIDRNEKIKIFRSVNDVRIKDNVDYIFVYGKNADDFESFNFISDIKDNKKMIMIYYLY